MNDTEIESSVELALRRLDARPDWRLKCWQCGHEDVVAEDPQRTASLWCSECSACTSFGAPAPPIAVVPHADRRFVVARVTHPPTWVDPGKVYELALERGYASQFAMELLSVCDPVRWQAVCALEEMAKRAREVAAAKVAGTPTEAPPATEGEAVASLDG